jgi:hypothetical protein
VVSPILPALNRLCGAMDPGLRRDDDHASECAQFYYTRFRGNDENKPLSDAIQGCKGLLQSIRTNQK